MYCKNCGNQIADNSKFCNVCGAVVSEEQTQGKKPSRSSNSRKTKRKKNQIVPIICAVIIVIVFVSCVSSIGNKSKNKQDNISDASDVQESTLSAQEETVANVTEATLTPAIATDWMQYYESNGDYVIFVDAEVMHEYGNYYAGSLACTVVEIANIGNQTINAKVDSDAESLTYSFTFNFSDSSEIENYKNGDIVEIVGTITQQTELFGIKLDTVSLDDCHIVAYGDDAVEKREELKSTVDTQVYYAQAYVQQLEADAEAAKIADKEDYKSSCISVDYDDVARNPSNYEGTDITVSGTVLQVSEGWFDSVTLRVSSNGGVTGDIWYVTYTRDENESRILEDDYITIYGESTGVTSYTTVLGSSVTIPSIKAKIIE